MRRAHHDLAGPDLGEKAAALAPPRKGQRGTTYTARIARTHARGDALVYPWGEEYRDRAELASIVAQLPGHPVVAPHPAGLLMDGVAGNVIGEVGRAWLDGEHAFAELVIRDDAAIVDGGWQELSLGYRASVDARGFQFGTLVDHVAIVPRGRCGETCNLRADAIAEPICACDAECYACTHMADTEKHADALRSLNSQLTEAEKRAKDAETSRDTEKLRADTAEGKILELNKTAEAMRAQIAAQQNAVETEAFKKEKLRADAAEEVIAKFDDKFEERVQARADLQHQAAAVMGPDFKMSGLSDREIRATVVKRLDAEADVTPAVPDGVITGRFLAATERYHAGARQLARVVELTAHADAVDKTEAKKTDRGNRWREPLPNSREARKVD